jgi:hypothetical protein
VADRISGYAVFLLVSGIIGWGLPRWFAWRRGVRRTLLNEADYV